MPGGATNRVVILGGGPAGLGAAYLLGQRGIEAVLLEQNHHVGGNAGSFELAGFPVDFGSHRFHPAAQPEVLQMVRELLGDDLLLRPRHGRIRLLDQWLRFPLKASDLLVHSPRSFALGVGRDLLRSMVIRRPVGKEDFETVLLHGLGKTICENFYFPYARKIWGMEPAEISPTQAYKRVESGTIGKILRRLVPKRAGALGGPGKDHFYYPRGGFGQISTALHEAASAQGVSVKLGARVSRLELGDDGHRVHYETVDGTHSLGARHVWSTIPITVLARLAGQDAPEPVLMAAKSLRFRGMLLIYLVLETGQFSPFDAHYFPGADIRITRLSEPKNYAARTEPVDVTVLCAELPCQATDATWQQGETALTELVIEDLARAGMPVRCPVKSAHVERLRNAYPLYPLGFEEHFDALDAWADNLPNVLTFGRQGLYAHDNTHHALAMAHAAVQCLRANGDFDDAAWLRARDVFAGHVVED